MHTTKDISIDILSQNIGNTKAIVFQNLKLDETKDVITDTKMLGAYTLKENQKFYSEDFQLSLNFYADTNKDEMYGFTYSKNFKDDSEDGYNITKILFDKLSKEYGDPNTYPGLSNKISDMPDYNKLNTDNISNYKETWEYNKLTITLNMDYIPNMGIRVSVQYIPSNP